MIFFTRRRNTLLFAFVLKIRLKKYFNETFFLTYGDGVSDINIKKLLEFHKKHNKILTVTAVRPPARFGYLSLDGDNVKNFSEKVYTTVIPRNVRLSEAPSHGMPVLIYDKSCPGSKSYFSFTDEFINQESTIGSAA